MSERDETVESGALFVSVEVRGDTVRALRADGRIVEITGYDPADAIATERAKRAAGGAGRGESEERDSALLVAIGNVLQNAKCSGPLYAEALPGAVRQVVRDRNEALETVEAQRKSIAWRAERETDTRAALVARDGESTPDAARRVVRERDEARKERDEWRRRAESAPSAALSGEAPRIGEESESARRIREYFDRAVREIERACGAAQPAAPAPEAFDAATLKVGDRVRLREATVMSIVRGVVKLQIDGERDPYGNDSQTDVWQSAIAGRVTP